MTVIPYASINANFIARYNYFENSRRKNTFSENSLKNLENNNTKGMISNKAANRIAQAVNVLHALSKPKRIYIPEINKTVKANTTLITLTLPAKQLHTDQYIKKHALNNFLQFLRDKYNMKAYIWRAETQKNGNIHFHIQTNIVAHFKILQSVWNRILEPLGYIDRFETKHGHRNPNTTDIHGVHKVKNLAAYLAKYLTKANEFRPVEGRQWFLSESLSKIEKIQFIDAANIARELDDFIKNNCRHFVELEFCFVAYCSFLSADLSKYPELKEYQQNFIKKYKHTLN